MTAKFEIEMEKPLQKETTINMDEEAYVIRSVQDKLCRSISSQSSNSSSRRWSEKREHPYHHKTTPTSTNPGKKVGFKLGVLSCASLCILICLVASLIVKRFSNHLGVFYGIEAWKWLVFWLVLLMGKPVTDLFINLIVLWVLRSFFNDNKNIIYFTTGLKTRIGVVTTLIALLFTWSLWLRNHAKHEPVSRTITALLVGAILWLVEGVLILSVASSFYFTSFFDRIQESIFHQYIVQMLSGTPTFESIQEVDDNDDNDHDIGKDMYSKLKGSTSRPAPLHLMQFMVEVVTNTELSYSTAEEGDTNNIKSITSKKEALSAARLMFHNVAKPGHRYMEVADFTRFLIKEEVDMVLPTLEVGRKGRITLQSFSRWMEGAYTFRVLLRHAMEDNKKAINQLTIVLDSILIFGVIIIWLVLVKIATGNIILVIFTQVAATAFIFGDSVKKVFEASIFLFAIHPFDVGGCCVINGTPVIIEKTSILTTTVSKFDQETIYYPNSVLSTKAISNYTRSPHMGDSLDFCIELMTPPEKVKQLKQEIRRFFKENTHHWKPGHSLMMKDIDGTDKIRTVLSFNHTIIFREFMVRKERKSTLITGLQKFFSETTPEDQSRLVLLVKECELL